MNASLSLMCRRRFVLPGLYLLVSLLVPHAACAAAPAPADDGKEYINDLVQKGMGMPVRLSHRQGVTTKATFRPPVEITIVAKTDSTDLRMGYAANQVIFNWADVPTQLRVDGGPANHKHRAGAGKIPVNKYVTIKWVVLPDKQTISVDGDLRYEHSGDYSQINEPVTVFCNDSKVVVQSIKVKELKP